MSRRPAVRPPDPASAAGPVGSQVELDEPTLVARAQDGDLDAYEALVDRYSGPLFRLALRLLGDRGAAEAVVRESLIKVWRRLPMITDPRGFAGSAYQLTTQLCLDLLRQRGAPRPGAVATDDLDQGHRSTASGPALAVRLWQLPSRQRAGWLLRELHGRSIGEIATTLGLTETAVRRQLARAHARLAQGQPRVESQP